MPRRTSVGAADFLGEESPQVLALPPPRPSGHRAPYIDPHQPLPGGSPTPEKPRRGRPRRDDPRYLARIAQVEQRGRYDRYLDALIALGGDKIGALAEVFRIDPAEASIRYEELHATVLAGAGGSLTAEVLERQDLGKEARVRLLRKHAYGLHEGASLKALEMASEMDADKGVGSSYERYLELVMDEG
uniref:Uncharacterized protein n=1 Tax=mine drainage metagenome TaxID=410659 RepID=E6QP95_9ZZZZ